MIDVRLTEGAGLSERSFIVMSSLAFLITSGVLASGVGAILGALYGGMARLYAWTQSWAHESTPQEAITNGARQGAAFLAAAAFLFVFLTNHRRPFDLLTYFVMLVALIGVLVTGTVLLLLGPAIVGAAITRSPLTVMLRKIGGYEWSSPRKVDRGLTVFPFVLGRGHVRQR